MKEKGSRKKGCMGKRIFPRIHADQYEQLLLVASKRGQNLSELTRSLYSDLLEKEFPNQKPAT